MLVGAAFFVLAATQTVALLETFDKVEEVDLAVAVEVGFGVPSRRVLRDAEGTN